MTARSPALPLGRTGRWERPLWFGVAFVVALLVLEAAWLLAIVLPESSGKWFVGIDYVYYRDVGARWLSSGAFYFDRQLTGPYEVRLLDSSGYGDVLYPPHALLLFVPFAVLPAILWWAVPVGVMAYAVWRWRPAPWALLLALGLLAWPRAIGAYLFGNTDIWMATGVAAGLLWGWPAMLVTMKPTLGMFALLGVQRRSWWLCAALLAVFVALSWPLWLDYLTAMRNVRGLDLGYNLGSLPLMLVPVVLWLGKADPVERRFDVVGSLFGMGR